MLYRETVRSKENINTARYVQQLEKLSAAITKERRGYGTRGVVFHHDNARLHTAKDTKAYLTELGWDVLKHPPYSPDLAPPDYHLFGRLQKRLEGLTFKSEAAQEKWLTGFFESLPPEFYEVGINDLPRGWQACIDAGGEYFVAK